MRGNILAFVAGICLLQQQPDLPPLVWSGFLPFLFLLAGMIPRDSFARKAARHAVLKLLFLAAGFFWAALWAHVRLQDALPPAWEGRDLRIAGVVAALPVENERGSRFEFDVEQVLTPGAVVPRHIQLSWYAARPGGPVKGVPPRVRPGERWQLTVRLKRIHGNANPNGFDYEYWALERNIRAGGYVRGKGDNRRLADLVYRPGYVVERMRQWESERFERVLAGRPYAGVLKALAIGDQSAISPAQWQVFRRTGVVHLFSISGLHVTMVAALAFFLVYGLWRRSATLTLRLPARKAAVAAGVAAALAYALLAGFAVPTQRTLYMLSVVAASLWRSRTSAPSTVLTLALLAVTVFDPWAVLAPGFWLSFGAVAAILYAGTGRVGRPSRLREWVVTQGAVTLALAPLLLALFQEVSLVSPLANAFAIPVVSLAVVPLTLAGAALPADFPLLWAHTLMEWCMAPLGWLAGLPEAVWRQHAPAPWAVVAALAGAAWLLLPRGFPTRWLGVTGFLPLVMIPPPTPPSGALWVTVLDVGQGLAVVAQTHGHALLYDTGPRLGPEADSGNRIIAPFLRASGIWRLDGMIVSHDDADHSGGAVSVMQAVPVDWLASSLPAGHPVLGQARRAVPCVAGQSWEWDGVRFDILHPPSGYPGGNADNDRSCVLKITSLHGSVLLPADIEGKSEGELLARHAAALPSTVLVAPHHGGKRSSGADFVRRVGPAVTIFSAGYRNRFGHPRAEVVERYRALGSQILRTDRDGAVLLRFEPGGLGVRTWRQAANRYWRNWQ
jgi:competence protein ComEC